MGRDNLNWLRTILVFVIFQTNLVCLSQTRDFPYREWITQLGQKTTPRLAGCYEMVLALKEKDTSDVQSIFEELESEGSGEAAYFYSRLNYTKALWAWNVNPEPTWKIDSVQAWIKKALNAAYETDDGRLISAISWQYSSMMYWSGLIEPAAMYSLYAAELDEKAGITSDANNFYLLGDLLYKTRDYEKAIYYTRRAFEGLTDTVRSKANIMSCMNTIGMCWQRMEKLDSALHYFNVAMQLARERNDSAWISIISGNEGQIYFLQKNYRLAKQLLLFDCTHSVVYGDRPTAANSMQWAARIELLEGEKDSALFYIKQALTLVGNKSAGYSENIYKTAAEIYGSIGYFDSAFKYSQLYNQLHASNEAMVANSRLEISRIKMENLENSLAINNMRRLRKSEEMTRNFLLAAVIMLAVIALLFLNRQRQSLLHKEELALAESRAAKEQLEMFKQNIVEKTALVEALQSQLASEENYSEQLRVAEELSEKTILTEDDWNQFKKLFEKIHPSFFIKLKEKANDITVAEQRMAALTRLHLNTKQIASMLGISVDSVHKTRQRLRQRFSLSSQVNLEEMISTF